MQNSVGGEDEIDGHLATKCAFRNPIRNTISGERGRERGRVVWSRAITGCSTSAIPLRRRRPRPPRQTDCRRNLGKWPQPRFTAVSATSDITKINAKRRLTSLSVCRLRGPLPFLPSGSLSQAARRWNWKCAYPERSCFSFSPPGGPCLAFREESSLGSLKPSDFW